MPRRAHRASRHRPTRTDLSALPDFITVEELQRLLRIGRTLAYEMLRTRKIRSIRFGRILRIPKTELIAHARDGR